MRALKLIVIGLIWATLVHAQGDPVVELDDGQRLVYHADKQGNRVVDFSHCGYRGAERKVPSVSPQLIVHPSGGDDTLRIQAAIESVSQQPLGKDGLRGAVLLGPGVFNVSGQLEIRASGIVLRGHGAVDSGTTIAANGQGRRPLIRVFPESQTQQRTSERGVDKELSISVIDDFVPVGDSELTVDSTSELSTGMRIEVRHLSSKAWIARLNIDRLGWREGTRDIRWERTITRIEGNRLSLDAPLTMAIDKAISQAKIRRSNRNQLSEIGIEDVTLVSDFDPSNSSDEEHAWYGVHMNGVRDAWVRRVQFKHFAGGAVHLGHQTSRISVVDCASLAPISEIGGYRRHTFFTLGQQCLFLRCWSEGGLHDFCAGHCSAGPNAFVNCYAKNALGDSGPRESCAIGVLYDNVRIEGHDLNLMNRWNSPPKSGWSAIGCVLWQCQAANVRCEASPAGMNRAIGLWATPAGDGEISQVGEFVKPLSLFQQQMRDRKGSDAAERVGPFLLKPVGATNPSIQQAEQFSKSSILPVNQLIDVIKDRWRNATLEEDWNGRGEKDRNATAESRVRGANGDHRLEISNGWLSFDNKIITGDYYAPMWWRGELPPERAKAMGPGITRFAPGRYGVGRTDDLLAVAIDMTKRGFVGYDHHYGLWYDRRRDDHLMVRRADGEVQPPFYEQPFARTGTGKAWDGLSRYDLTTFNPWYWERLRQFAVLGEQHGLLLFHHNYFQHNILEAGAHWADSPWRPANNVNDTGLPEPPPYVGDKRIFLDEQFYDPANSKLRKLQRAYIRKCLNNFLGQHNVVQLTSGEYTGPLLFMQFWIDTIAEWETETGHDAVVALSCTKDVQDAILADPERARHVDIIDIRYWTYTNEGGLHAPAGGQHLSPRQHLRRLKPASTSFDSILRSVREYRLKYSNKAVTYNAHLHCRAKRDGWAILLGGGSLPNTPPLEDELVRAICKMKPSKALNLASKQWCLSDDDGNHLLYSDQNLPTRIPLPTTDTYTTVEISVDSGRQIRESSSAETLVVPEGRHVFWLRK